MLYDVKVVNKLKREFQRLGAATEKVLVPIFVSIFIYPSVLLIFFLSTYTTSTDAVGYVFYLLCARITWTPTYFK